MQFRRTLGDPARLNNKHCFGVVERYHGLKVAAVVALHEGRINVFRPCHHHRTKYAPKLERSIDITVSSTSRLIEATQHFSRVNSRQRTEGVGLDGERRELGQLLTLPSMQIRLGIVREIEDQILHVINDSFAVQATTIYLPMRGSGAKCKNPEPDLAGGSGFPVLLGPFVGTSCRGMWGHNLSASEIGGLGAD